MYWYLLSFHHQKGGRGAPCRHHGHRTAVVASRSDVQRRRSSHMLATQSGNRPSIPYRAADLDWLSLRFDKTQDLSHLIDSRLALRNYASSPVEATAGGIIDCLQRIRGTSVDSIDKNAVFVLDALQCQRQGFATHKPHLISARLPLVASGAVCTAGDRSG